MIVYYACPKCDFIERVSDYVCHIIHRHDGVMYSLLACHTLKEAKEVYKASTK